MTGRVADLRERTDQWPIWRREFGVRALDEIDYAVLKRSGDIAIIPRASAPD